MLHDEKKMHKKQQSWSAWFLEMISLLTVVFVVRTFVFGLYQVPSGSMETTMLVGERFLADKLSYWFKKPERFDIVSFNAPPGKDGHHFKYSDNPVKRLWQKYVYGPDNWTKRVIGLPGETVRGVIEAGRPVIYIKNNSGECKLDDSQHVNKYPLILTGLGYLDRIKQQKLKSFNPDIRDAQGNTLFNCSEQFYRIETNHIPVLSDGKPYILMPHTPLDVYHPGDSDNSDVFERVLGNDEYWVMGDNRLGSYDSRMWGPVKGDMIHGKIIFRLWSSDSDESWWIVDLIKHPIDFWKRIRWSRCLNRVH
jgi:signal peptidase I